MHQYSAVAELDAGSGDDALYGSEGRDTLTGGKGKDVFILSTGEDTITDFKVGKDDIGLVYALNLKLRQRGNDLLVIGDDDVRTLLEGVNKADFLADQGDLSKLPIVEVEVL